MRPLTADNQDTQDEGPRALAGIDRIDDADTALSLASCETGLGDVHNDDEVLGFTRSFLSSGTGALGSTLWEVDHFATATEMTTFYSDLVKGMDVQDATRNGQPAVLRNPKTAQPFLLAPFSLIGNWRLTVAK